jgi:hypothetical protein
MIIDLIVQWIISQFYCYFLGSIKILYFGTNQALLSLRLQIIRSDWSMLARAFQPARPKGTPQTVAQSICLSCPTRADPRRQACPPR